MTWNYRIVAKPVDGATAYFIAEVHYDELGRPKGCSGMDFNVLHCDDLDDLVATMKRVANALASPVLHVVDGQLIQLPGEPWYMGGPRPLRYGPNPALPNPARD